MKNRGQVILEFIFIILIVVIYIFTVTKPFIDNSQNTITDIEALTRTNNETEKLVDSINKLYLLGNGSRETLDLFVPIQGKIICNDVDNNIGFTVDLTNSINQEHSLCPNNVCTKSFELNDDIDLDCLMPEVNNRATVVVSKENNIIIVGG
jgi:uncharacterized protein (UPF0333 family)